MPRFTSSFALLLAAAPALGAPPLVNGEYDSPLGRVRVAGDGTEFTGSLIAPSGPCAFPAGAEVLKGTLLDDSLAGQVRLCLAGAGCEAEAWAKTVLLVTPAGLTGAAHVKAGCRAPLGQRGGITFARAAAPLGDAAAAGSARAPPPKRAAPKAAPPRGAQARARVNAVIEDAFRYAQEGYFERARARFKDAIALDPRRPEPYNGVGVTYRMRNDLPAAVAWYKQALAVNPDFGGAYYNLACVYALQGREDLALRYLQIAAMNGYVSLQGIEEDPDLVSLRGTPAFQALVKVRL